MTPTWHSDEPPELAAIGALGWGRAVLRGVPLVVVIFGGLAVLLLLRLVERPLYGLHRPITPAITQWVCRMALRLLNIRPVVEGRAMTGPGALVANHSSWLDIFVLNATGRLYFVSKAEVRSWPGIGWLARATGTVFINRDRREAQAQTRIFEERLLAGHRLLFFPEGTSTDGRRVLPFKSTLFGAFFHDRLVETIRVQPISVRYAAPEGADPRYYAWWGDMEFGPHLLKLLAAGTGGAVTVTYHAPVAVAETASRKELAARCEAEVRAGFEAAGA